MKFGEWLRERREECGMTQLELAERIGKSRQYVWMLENGGRPKNGGRLTLRPSFEGVVAIASVLLLSVGEVAEAAGYVIPSRGDNKTVRRITAIIEDLSAEDQEDVLAYAEMRLKRARLLSRPVQKPVEATTAPRRPDKRMRGDVRLSEIKTSGRRAVEGRKNRKAG